MDYSFFILIISVFASRFIQLNAFRTLADEDKGKVLSKNIMQLSQVSMVITILLIVAFYLLISKFPDNATTITASFFVALIAQRIIVYLFTRKRMTDNGVPSTYTNKYFLSWLITTVGVALFIVLFMQQFNHALAK
ncbi:hypothetical protein [Parafilimonas sp.]|uniref:hypothetical protein n=1 Tax=Parafilimonas sp. TaxID=1969739 RepID=UPI0039E5162E